MPIKITASMVQRYESKRFGFNDPCIVCGGNFNICGHDSSEVIYRIRGLGAEGRERIRNALEPEAEEDTEITMFVSADNWADVREGMLWGNQADAEEHAEENNESVFTVPVTIHWGRSI